VLREIKHANEVHCVVVFVFTLATMTAVQSTASKSLPYLLHIVSLLAYIFVYL